MKIISYDSPVMETITFAVEILFLNLLCFVCSIPIFTSGAALSAKYFVTMKLYKKESPPIIKTYFRAFKDNFKQSTTIFLIQIPFFVILLVDWNWMYDQGWSNVPSFYFIIASVLTLIVVFTNVSIYPIISRFKLTTKEAIKLAMTFSFIHFIPMALVVIAQIILVVVCIWYFEWLPLVLVVGSLSITLFYTMFLVKKFGKIEKTYLDEDGNPKKKGEKKDEETAENEETESAEENSENVEKTESAEENSENVEEIKSEENLENTEEKETSEEDIDNIEENKETEEK